MAKADRRAGSASVEEALPEDLRAQLQVLGIEPESIEVPGASTTAAILERIAPSEAQR